MNGARVLTALLVLAVAMAFVVFHVWLAIVHLRLDRAIKAINAKLDEIGGDCKGARSYSAATGVAVMRSGPRT